MKKNLKIFILTLVMIVSTLLILTGCGKQGEKTEGKIEEVGNTLKQENQQETKIEPSMGVFARRGEDIYYWNLDNNSREKTALWGKYYELGNYKKCLIKLDSKGNKTEIIKENGVGKICVTENKIYYEVIDNNVKKVCSVNIDGNNKKEYGQGELKYVIGDYIYVKNTMDIYTININTDEYKEVLKNAELIGVTETNAYYTIQKDNMEELKIGYISNSKDNGIVTNVKSSDYTKAVDNSKVTLIDFNYTNAKVIIEVGDVQGTSQFVQQGFKLTMDADGKNFEKADIYEGHDNEGDISVLVKKSKPVDFYNDGLIYTELSTGRENMLLTASEVKREFGFKEDEENIITVFSSDVIGDDIYIVIDNGKHDESQDIGWRYAYTRTKTVAFKYNLKTKQIDKIYEF